MSKIKFNHLLIRTNTDDGLYGADIQFKSGLNIIHAENTHGKSTCIQTILYALGLEGCLGPSRKVPLKTALTSSLRKGNGDKAHIFETKIYLEIENSNGSVITLARSSIDEKKDLISVFDGTVEEAYKREVNSNDYYVRFEGSAIRERGFQHFLCNFLNISQPQVMKFDGKNSQLYLESIFSVNYVEQTRGWGGILNILPTYLGIKDLPQRVIEYTLALDIQNHTKKKQELLNKKKDFERLWAVNFDKLESVASNLSGYVSSRLNDEINKDTMIYSDTDLFVYSNDGIERSFRQEHEDIERKLFLLKSANLNIASSEIDTAKIKKLDKDLSMNLSILSEEEEGVSILIADLNVSEKYTKSIKNRIDDINDSLRKYKDLKRLEDIGSEEDFSILKGKCPTCDGVLDDSLLPHVNRCKKKILGLDDNIKYLEKQKEAFVALHNGELRKSDSKSRLLSQAINMVKERRKIIRCIKDSLIDSKSTPSRADIKEELLLEGKLERLEHSLNREKDIKIDLEIIVNDWLKADSAINALPKDGFSYSDKKKLRTLKELFNNNLDVFGYSSNDISEFEISYRTYKPALNDIDISSEASASDNIRVIWSYLYSILTLDQSDIGEINHLGVLILDEPRQQETKHENFKSFIKKAAETKSMNKQIILGTSEDYAELKNMLLGVDAHVKHFDSDIISKVKV